MADARIFTDYRANCKLLPPLHGGTWADYDRRAVMLNGGQGRIADERRKAVLRGGSSASSCVDTMVPELKKRVYAWNGPVGEKLVQPVGVGTGRFYLPGRLDLLDADPDVVALATIPQSMLFGTHSAAGGSYVIPTRHAILPPTKNRYSGPYGNF
jgi:hypothetical protein